MMTTPRDPTSQLEQELSALFGAPGLSPAGQSLIDARVQRALRSRPPVVPGRRRFMLAAALSLLAALAFAGGAVAHRFATEGGFHVVDGILFREGVVGRPGLTNFGQPFWGTDIYERTPPAVAEMAAEKGYLVRWQIEDRAPGGRITFSGVPPACGDVQGGSVVEDGLIQLVVVRNDPAVPASSC
jgi:hypothetical protein